MKASSIVKTIKNVLVDLEDNIGRPEIHLTNTVTSEVIKLCMLPEKISVKNSTSFRSWNIIERGEIKLPKCEQLTQISWSGLLPSARMLLYDFIKHEYWEQPREIVRALKRWRERGEKLKLLVSQTPINLDVYLKTFDVEHSGAHGHYKYNVQFIAAKELKILTVAEADAEKSRAKDTTAYEIKRRAAMKSKTGIWMARVNTIWEAAKILTGNGGDWEKVLELNGFKEPTNIDPETYIMH